MHNRLNLTNYKKIEFTKLNEQFLIAKCYVLALGKNDNLSYFSKENVDKAYSSLNFIPVVGHVQTDDNGNYYLGGHDVKLDLTNGFQLKSLCIPYGVAIPSPTPIYEDVTEDDGSIATYLITNVILWVGRYPEIEKTFYNNEIFCGQSMEITYTNSEPLEEDKKYSNIIDFSFDALCMLGKSDDERFNVEPCFPNAKIESLSFSLDKKMFDDFKKDIIKELHSLKVINFCKEGGKIMDKKLDLLKKYNVESSQLDFNLEDFSLDEIEQKLKEKFEKKDNKVEQSMFTTYKEKRNLISNLFSDVVERDVQGKITKEIYYYLMDFDDKFAYVEVSVWENDAYSCDMYRYPIAFSDNEKEVSLNGEREKLFKMWLTEEEKNKIEDDRTQYQSYKNTHSHSNEEYEKLFEYKKTKEKEEFDLGIENIKVEFEDISDKKEFENLIKEKDNFTLDDFKEKCFYIRGLYAKPHKISFSKNNSTIKLNLNDDNDIINNDPRSYLYEKYLNK